MPKTGETTEALEDRSERYSRAAALLRQWLAEADREDAGAYDWPAIDRELKDVAARCRDSTTDDNGVQ